MRDLDDKVSKVLFNEPSGDWRYADPEKYRADLLDQYKLYLEMADRISARRQAANSFFLAVNTGLVGFIGYLAAKSEDEFSWVIGIAGVTLSYGWHRLILSYQGLNTAKFKVIHAIEKRLPLSPYDAEWEYLGRGENYDLYKPFTNIELNVPWVFVILHSFVILRTMHWKAAWDCAFHLFGKS